MIDLIKGFKEIGTLGVKLYKESLEKWDRVATGKTKNSIRFDVTQSSNTTKLTFYALDHIRDLENGRTAAQVRAKMPFFDQIVDWVDARRKRGDNVPSPTSTLRIIAEYGWNTTLPNRTGQNGGTKGIITDVDKLIIESAKETVAKQSKSQILNTLKATKRN